MEAKRFIESKNQQEVFAVSRTDRHKLFAAYLVDIFAVLKTLNLK